MPGAARAPDARFRRTLLRHLNRNARSMAAVVGPRNGGATDSNNAGRVPRRLTDYRRIVRAESG
jgi:hypothetical protein